MKNIKISNVKLVTKVDGHIYSFESNKSLKGVKEGIIIKAIEDAINPSQDEKALNNEGIEEENY